MFGILLKEAFSSIISNKSRTFLTLLGIVIGIASVLTVMAAGDGGKKIIMQEFEGLSPRALNINPNYQIMRTNMLFRRELITEQDLDDLENLVEDIEHIAPIQSTNTIIKTGSLSKDLNIVGTNNNYIEFVEFELAAGRIITEEEVRQQQKVAIIGSKIAEEFFPGLSAVGEYINALGTPMRVIGVLKEKIKTGEFSLSNPDDTYNNVVVVPVTVFRRIWGNQGGYFMVLANAKSIAQIDAAREKILKVLARNHGKWDERFNKFSVTSMKEQLEMIDKVVGTVTLGVAILAGIALLVAAIGIMNIMLVSVKERTREIGIRKALGAKRGQIMLQFLIETILLCGGGGVIGLGVAFLAAYIIGELAHWPAVIEPFTSVLAILLALITGLLSGVFPASRAAQLPPQEALRYE